MAEEKRHFHRVGHDARATLTLGSQVWHCTVEDLCLNGCLIELDQGGTIEPERVHHLSIHLTEAIHIEMEVVLAYQAGNLVGCRCVGIDTDSIGQLRRLIELNLGDSRLLERDMRELIRG